jgi:hypothetical protein
LTSGTHAEQYNERRRRVGGDVDGGGLVSLAEEANDKIADDVSLRCVRERGGRDV